jgi:hypothetical protein
MTDSLAAALALAAIAADDPRATRAALGPELRERVDAVLADRSRHADRTDAIRALLASVRPALPSSSTPVPPRARALLATLAAREIGVSWLSAAPPPRKGFRVSAALRSTILAIPESEWHA